MDAADGLDVLLEDDDDDSLAFGDLLRDAPPGCLFCILGELGEGDDD